jgi:pimeloyl-ACP methyl ester carboxylesterase
MRVRCAGEGPTVIKLAGIAGGVGLYEEEVSAVAAAGYRVASLDVGGDRWDDPASCPLSWDYLASEVCCGLDAIAAPRAVLWGTSFGCLIALASAARYPDRIAGLLLCKPPLPGRLPRVHAALFRWASHRRDPARAGRIVFVLGYYLLTSWEALYPTVIVRLPALARASIDAATPSATLWQKIGLLQREPPGFPPPRHRIPIAIIAGSWDTIAPPAGARRLAAALPGSRLRFLLHSGHSGAYSRPRAYARMVIEELERMELR